MSTIGSLCIYVYFSNGTSGQFLGRYWGHFPGRNNPIDLPPRDTAAKKRLAAKESEGPVANGGGGGAAGAAGGAGGADHAAGAPAKKKEGSSEGVARPDLSQMVRERIISLLRSTDR